MPDFRHSEKTSNPTFGRDPPPSYDQAVGPGLHLIHPADGIRQGRHLAHALHDAGNALRRQGEAVQHGRAHPRLLGGGYVFGVGGQPCLLMVRQDPGDGLQRGVLFRCSGSGEHVGGGLGGSALLL